MMIRALTLAAGLAAASTAHAGFVGWDMRVDVGATADAQALGGALAGATVYRMYAVFDSEGDKVLNVFNADFATTDGSTLYQDTFGGNVAPNAAFVAVFPTLAFDSFVTINELTNGGSTSIATDPDFAFTTNGVVGGWFNSNPPNNQGATVLNGSVWEALVGQFTVVGGTGALIDGPTGNTDGRWFGQASITYNDATGATQQFAGQGFIPTPGAVALFGLAGLTAGRRRRSA
jgi:hypothetical protein